jgi:hypothetical protein
MEETNFVLLWKEHYEKIDRSLAINKRMLAELLNQKVESSVQAFIRVMSLGIVAGFFYLFILGGMLAIAIAHYHSPLNYFFISIACIFGINVKAVSDYIRYVVLINGVRYDGSVTETQNKLRNLQVSLVRHTRFMLLQLPFWSTFYLSSSWFPSHAAPGYIAIQIAVTGAFTWLAIWFYRKISPANIDNRLTRILVSGIGGKALVNALKFYKELEELNNG